MDLLINEGRMCLQLSGETEPRAVEPGFVLAYEGVEAFMPERDAELVSFDASCVTLRTKATGVTLVFDLGRLSVWRLVLDGDTVHLVPYNGAS